MFEPSSRYYRVETLTLITREGRTISYKKRRFLPDGPTLPLLGEHTTTEGDRLDLIADTTIGDAEQFWRICDANNAMNPFDLIGGPGRVLRIPVPQFEEPK